MLSGAGMGKSQMARIFISYSHEDQGAAKRVVDALASEGFDSWWDHDIPPGRSWDEVIGRRIEAADVVIVIWSSRSILSNFVKEEAQLAFDAGKLLPVKVEEVYPPVGFRRVHAANLVDWHGEADYRQWKALLAEVVERLGVSTTPPPIPPALSPASLPTQIVRSKLFPVTRLWQAGTATVLAIGASVLFLKPGTQTDSVISSDRSMPAAAASVSTTDRHSIDERLKPTMAVAPPAAITASSQAILSEPSSVARSANKVGSPATLPSNKTTGSPPFSTFEVCERNRKSCETACGPRPETSWQSPLPPDTWEKQARENAWIVCAGDCVATRNDCAGLATKQ